MNDENFDEQFKKLNSKGYLYIKNDFLDLFRDHKNYFIIKQIYSQFEKLLKVQFKQLNKKLQNTLAPDFKLEIDLYYFKLNSLMYDVIDYLDLHYHDKLKKREYKNILDLLKKFNLIDLLFHLDEKILELYKNFIVDISNEKPSDDIINLLKNIDTEQYLNDYYKNFYEHLKNNFFKQFTPDLKEYLNWTFLGKEANPKFNTYFLTELHQLNFDKMFETYLGFYFHLIRQTTINEAEKNKTFKNKVTKIEFDKTIFENFYNQVELNLLILHFIELYHDQQNKELANFFEACNRTYKENKKNNPKYLHKDSVHDTFKFYKSKLDKYKELKKTRKLKKAPEDPIYKKQFSSDKKIKLDLVKQEEDYRLNKQKILSERKKILVRQLSKQALRPSKKIKR